MRDKSGRFLKGYSSNTNTQFRKGSVPWNKGIKGYKLLNESETKKRLYAEGKIKIWNKGTKGLTKGYWLGKNRDQATIEKISKNRKGKCMGKENPFFGKKHSVEVIEIIKAARARTIFPLKDSSIELKIQNYLKFLNIDFQLHKQMNIKHSYQADIFIPSMNLVIETDGDYWHGNPKVYSYDKLSEQQVKQKIKDIIRTKELKDAGYNVLRLWESDINQISISEFKSQLINQKNKLILLTKVN